MGAAKYEGGSDIVSSVGVRSGFEGSGASTASVDSSSAKKSVPTGKSLRVSLREATGKVPFREVVQYQGVVLIYGLIHSKMLPRDLLTMELPVFFPDKEFYF